MKKLLLLFVLLILACSDEEGNPCVYEPTLTTQAATDITETSATLNGTIDVYSQNCDTVENILQGFVYSTSSEPTIDDDIVNIDGTSITESLTNLEPNTTYYVRVFLVRPLIGVFYGNEVSFVTEESIDTIDCDVTRLWENNNLIEATNSDCIDDNSVKKVLREYNENLNPIRFYWNDWHIWFGTVIELAGVFGKGSENLLSKSTTLYDDDDDNSIDREEIYNYYYQLDEDGYPSVINIITTYSNSMIERSVTYQLTYTN